MQSLGLERPYLGGVSYGGMLLIEFLLKHQEMCRAALIVSATARGREKTSERSMYFPNRVEELSKINTPSLVVQATNDGAFPPEHGEEMASRMPNAELVVLEGGHTINNLNPSEFNLRNAGVSGEAGQQGLIQQGRAMCRRYDYGR